MSKIPQGEWNAIAARYAQGESISTIARSYGCTPPAIHYILKQNRLRTPQESKQPLNGRLEPLPTQSSAKLQTPAPSVASRPAELRREEHGAFRSAPAEIRTSPAPTGEFGAGRGRDFVAAAGVTRNDEPQPAPPQQRLGDHRKTSQGSAFTAGLDSELHGRAEAAIQAFRASFDAALVEGSPIVRQRLRQAASDLMRVAARTTIVLDRLNANAERSRPARYPD